MQIFPIVVCKKKVNASISKPTKDTTTLCKDDLITVVCKLLASATVSKINAASLAGKVPEDVLELDYLLKG